MGKLNKWIDSDGREYKIKAMHKYDAFAGRKAYVKFFLMAFIMSLALLIFSGCGRYSDMPLFGDSVSRESYNETVNIFENKIRNLEGEVRAVKLSGKCFKKSYDYGKGQRHLIYKVVPQRDGLDVNLFVFKKVCDVGGKPCVLALDSDYSYRHDLFEATAGGVIKCPTTLNEWNDLGGRSYE